MINKTHKKKTPYVVLLTRQWRRTGAWKTYGQEFRCLGSLSCPGSLGEFAASSAVLGVEIPLCGVVYVYYNSARILDC